MTLDDLKAILEPAGFVHQSGGMLEHLSSSFIKPAGGHWSIGAHAGWEGNEAPYVDIGLMLDLRGATIGTVHRVTSVAALRSKLREIITGLEAATTQEDLLKCPECGVRWVALKEPSAGGKQFTPFLSCQGMYKARSGKEKFIPCRGISRRIPALVIHG